MTKERTIAAGRDIIAALGQAGEDAMYEVIEIGNDELTIRRIKHPAGSFLEKTAPKPTPIMQEPQEQAPPNVIYLSDWKKAKNGK